MRLLQKVARSGTGALEHKSNMKIHKTTKDTKVCLKREFALGTLPWEDSTILGSYIYMHRGAPSARTIIAAGRVL